MYNEKLLALWDFLTEYGIATDKEIELVTDICGYNETAMLDILYARTGYRSVEQFRQEECDNEY